MSRRIVTVLAAALVAVTVAGCGGSDLSAEQWTDQMCGAVLPFARTATTPPSKGADPAGTTREISGYLGRSVTALDGALGTLERLGPAPVDDGEAVSNQLRDGLGQVRTAFATAKTQVDALDTRDPAALEQKLPEALAPLSRLGSATGPLAGLTGNPQLNAAMSASANCRDLASVSRAAQGSGAGTGTPGGGGN